MTVRGEAITALNARSPTIVALSNNTASTWVWNANAQYYNSTLAGVVLAALNKYEAAAIYTYSPGDPAPGLYPYSSMDAMFVAGASNLTVSAEPAPTPQCMNYVDPKDTVLEDMNRLMFYLGYLTGSRTDGSVAAWLKSELEPGLEADPIIIGRISGYHNVYRSNFRWFGAAATVQALCIALVLPTFIGWWTLGRPVSFSPIEIAKARVIRTSP